MTRPTAGTKDFTDADDVERAAHVRVRRRSRLHRLLVTFRSIIVPIKAIVLDLL